MHDAARSPSPRGNPSARIADIENQVLRVLCSRLLARSKWEQLARALADHAWQEPEHRVVFAALREIRNRDQKTWREQLPAQATRMGFPDVDWAAYFAPGEKTKAGIDAEVGKMLRTLKNLVAERR